MAALVGNAAVAILLIFEFEQQIATFERTSISPGNTKQSGHESLF